MRRPWASLGASIPAAFLAVTPLFATMSIYLPPEGLAEIAPVVVEGDVTRVASGYDPETGSLATYVSIGVVAAYRGPNDLREIVLRQPGGRYGGLVHEVDAVPVYEPGERVFVFVEFARDGAPRTAGMFFGKFAIRQGATRDGDRATRDLSGQGTILRRPDPSIEDLPVRDLVAVVENHPFRSPGTSKPAVRRPRTLSPPAGMAFAPPELDRLLWDDERVVPGSAPVAGGGGSLAAGYRPVDVGAPPAFDFTPLSATSPTRWEETDSGTAITVNIEQARNPLSNGPAAVNEIKRGMAAWTHVPEGRVMLESGNENYNFSGTNAQSPAVAYPPVNIVLFGDPYGEITDPSGCSGVLALGGYWRSGSTGRTVNNVTFYPALRLYLIFNNAFECFLGNTDNLAEVAAHELGHGIGFGHSTVADSIMRATAYGNGRGPRLGDDDRDAAHCHYPHTLAVTAPNGGESWTAGTVHSISWTATTEAGADPGTVSLEYSTDSGSSWLPIATGEANDGTYSWTVPSAPGAHARVRVIRPNRVSPTPFPYPSACSSDATNADFTIAAANPAAGTVPDGAPGAPVRVAKAAGADLTMTWGASCAGTATDYAIYEGTLSALRAGSWDHLPVACSAGADLTQTLTPGVGSRYYLVAPRAGSIEGTLGARSSGTPRPASQGACAPREASSCE
ncbi:MAG: matrixin family metalloprotease [Acidobacteriia bacterium]|nr:matrixin family metalloprotease [Terriglobia bacterium]